MFSQLFWFLILDTVRQYYYNFFEVINMLLKDINPFIRQAVISTLTIHDTQDTFNELQTRDCRLFYILSDSGSMVIGGKKYDLHYGCAILFQSGTKYTWKVGSRNKIDYISLNFDYTQNHSHVKTSIHPIHSSSFDMCSIFERIEFDDANILNEPLVIDNCTFLESRMRLVTTEFYLGDNYCDELLSSIVKSIIISMVRRQHRAESMISQKDLRLTEKILEYIQTHYAKPLTNEAIAKEFHINPIYMNRIFKSQTGSSIHAFILQYRLNAAMTILRTGNISVQETAIMVGFSDPVHFNKIFKKYIGTTPNQYRNAEE